MTEKTLGEAIKIKRQIDHLRERKAEIETQISEYRQGKRGLKGTV